LGLSLVDEEVLSGDNVQLIGRAMLRASADIEWNPHARESVTNNCDAIIDILLESEG
jgi:hypothetical protein